MSGKPLVGWQILHKLIENDIKSEKDVIIAVTHWFLIKEGGFLCLGTGDKKTLDADEEGSEFLPTDWNIQNNGSHSLRYVYNDVVYVLLVTTVGETVILNLLSSKSLDVSNVALNIKETVDALTVITRSGSRVIIHDISPLLARLHKELLEPVRSVVGKTTTTETQTPATNDRQSVRIPDGVPLLFPNLDPLRAQPRIDDPLRNVGRGDLDPFGRGGGMLFNPPGRFQPHMPGIPPLGRIPGARFDPFSTPDPDRFGRVGPNPDHLPPPGYDDMFM